MDKLVIDIDHAKSPDKETAGTMTIDNVKDVIAIMQEMGIQEKHFNLWFSGTGFHIHLANVYGFKDKGQ